MSAAPAPASRVVVYRLGSLGDTVVALPCFHAVAAAYPDAERILLTNFPVNAKAAPLEAILGGSGLLHRFVAYPLGTRSFTTLRRLRQSLRALDTRTLVYLSPARGRLAAWRDVLFFRLCGFTDIVGAPLTKDLQRNRRGADGCIERECQRLARAIASLGPVELDEPRSWDVVLTEDERAAGAAALSPLAGHPRITLNMGGKVPKNDWGEPNWRALVMRLRTSCAGHALVFVGGPEDADRADRIGDAWPGPVVNLCGKVSPRVSAAAMSGSSVFVGHDSGPLHLAACTGVPCVSMFGDNNEPRKWHPVGAHHRIIHDMRGVSAVSVEQIEEAVLSRIALATEAAIGDGAPIPTAVRG